MSPSAACFFLCPILYVPKAGNYHGIVMRRVTGIYYWTYMGNRVVAKQVITEIKGYSEYLFHFFAQVSIITITEFAMVGGVTDFIGSLEPPMKLLPVILAFIPQALIRKTTILRNLASPSAVSQNRNTAYTGSSPTSDSVRCVAKSPLLSAEQSA